jgi:hypothetical protein
MPALGLGLGVSKVTMVGGTPVEPVVISAPDGVYPGNDLFVTGGCLTQINVGEEPTDFDGVTWVASVYQLYVDGYPVGDEFTVSPTTIPFVTTGQKITVRDSCGNVSNELIAEGIDVILRLQTHRGDGVPVGLYQDAACTIPATDDGDPVGGWKDELSNSGLVAVQSVSTKRPILKFVSGIPVLRFDGIDDFLIIATVPTISGVVGFASTAFYSSATQANGRLLSIASATGFDFDGTTGFVAGYRPGTGSSIGTQFGSSYGAQSVMEDEWLTFASRATGAAIETWKNGDDKSTTAIDTSAIASTRIKIAGSFAFSEVDDLWGGDISSATLGPWTESEILLVQEYLTTLRPA